MGHDDGKRNDKSARVRQVAGMWKTMYHGRACAEARSRAAAPSADDGIFWQLLVSELCGPDGEAGPPCGAEERGR